MRPNHSFFSFFHPFNLSFHFLHSFILFISVFLLHSGCKPSSQQEIKSSAKEVTLPYIIDIEKNIDNVKELPVSLIAKNLEYIPLETKKNCLLRKVSKLVFTDSFIFVSDFNKLLQFNRKGKFIRQIGKNGKGPGEYVYVMSFDIDYYSNQVYIMDYSPRIEVFDFSGNYIRQFDRSKIISYQFLGFDKDKLIFHFANMPKHYDPTEVSLMITDTKGNPLKEFKNYKKRKSKPGIMVSESPLYSYNNKFYFMEFLNDTLFSVEEDKLKPYAIIKLGNWKMDPDPTCKDKKEIKELESKLWITRIIENEKFLFINMEFGFNDSLKFCAFNKRKGELTVLRNSSLQNDIDGGFSFLPKYIYNDNIFVDYMDASVFLEKITSTGEISNPELSQLTSQIKEDDNPILIIAKP